MGFIASDFLAITPNLFTYLLLAYFLRQGHFLLVKRMRLEVWISENGQRGVLSIILFSFFKDNFKNKNFGRNLLLLSWSLAYNKSIIFPQKSAFVSYKAVCLGSEWVCMHNWLKISHYIINGDQKLATNGLLWSKYHVVNHMDFSYF